jgi:hypothetical protein
VDDADDDALVFQVEGEEFADPGAVRLVTIDH